MIPLGFPYFRLVNIGWFPSSPYFRLINVGWFPCLKIKKFVGFNKFHFMFFDRYEIHILAFGDVFWWKSYHVPILISTKLYQKMYSLFSQKIGKWDKPVHRLSTIFVFFDVHTYKHNIFPGGSQIFLYCWSILV